MPYNQPIPAHQPPPADPAAETLPAPGHPEGAHTSVLTGGGAVVHGGSAELLPDATQVAGDVLVSESVPSAPENPFLAPMPEEVVEAEPIGLNVAEYLQAAQPEAVIPHQAAQSEPIVGQLPVHTSPEPSIRPEVRPAATNPQPPAGEQTQPPPTPSAPDAVWESFAKSHHS